MTARRGSIFIFSLLTIAILMVLSGSYLSFVSSDSKINIKSCNLITAMNVAEAGAEVAIWEFMYDGADFSAQDGYSGTNTKTKTATVQSSSGQTIGQYTITVTGYTGPDALITVTGYVPNIASATAQKTVAVSLKSETEASAGIFATDRISLSSNAQIDSYDSRLGNYSYGTSGSDGNVGTNAISAGAINLSSNARIKGDATVGPNGDPNTAITLSSNATITGIKQTASALVEMPSVAGPSGLPDAGSINLRSNTTQTISTNGQYSSITLNSNSRLIINSDATIYITNSLSLNSNSRIEITNGATVEIYVDRSVNLASNANINNVGRDPAKFSLYGTDTMTTQTGGMQLSSNSFIYGALYARNSLVSLSSNAVIYGAITSKEVSLSSNAAIHYDLALQSSGGGDSDWEVSYWQEK